MLMLPFYKRRVMSSADAAVTLREPKQWFQRFLLIDSVRCDGRRQRSPIAISDKFSEPAILPRRMCFIWQTEEGGRQVHTDITRI